MIHLDVTIMGQPYRLACKEGEQHTLREAVAFLDGKMSALRDAGKVKGNDRIAVMAALGMAAEFLSMKSPQGPLSDMSILDVKQKMEAMHTVLDAALTPQENLF
jgi:cell division protein ZapA